MGEVSGKTIREIVTDIEPYWMEYYGKVAKTGEAIRFESFVAPLDRWFRCHAFRMDSSAPHKLAVLFRDTTERKRTVEALRLSEERFYALVEQVTVGISEGNADGRFIFVNDRFCEICGYSREELLKTDAGPY